LIALTKRPLGCVPTISFDAIVVAFGDHVAHEENFG